MADAALPHQGIVMSKAPAVIRPHCRGRSGNARADPCDGHARDAAREGRGCQENEAASIVALARRREAHCVHEFR